MKGTAGHQTDTGHWTMSGLGVKTELIGDLITQLSHSLTSYNVTFIPLASCYQ